MKRLLLLLLSVIVCVTMQGKEHIKYRGIPLDGTIESFSQRFKTKGVNYDAEASPKIMLEAKLYKDTFMDENTLFFVMINAKSHIVYSVGGNPTYSTMELAKTPFFNIAYQIHKNNLCRRARLQGCDRR